MDEPGVDEPVYGCVYRTGSTALSNVRDLARGPSHKR